MSDSEQPTKNPPPPRRKPGDPLGSKWGVAIAASLVFHIGMGAVLALNPPRPVPPMEDRRPYTPETYATKSESAQAKVRKMEQIARKMESLHQKARENYEKRTGQKLPPLPSTPPPKGAAERSLEEARLAQSEAQEAQQDVETALRDADAALAKGDLTGYRESARRAAQAARAATEAQNRVIAAQKRAAKSTPAPELPAEKPVIDAAMKQQIAAAQAQRTAQAEMVKAADAQTLQAAKKAQAKAKAAQEESARKQAEATQRQEEAEKSPLPMLPEFSAEALQAMLSQEMALKALNVASEEVQEVEGEEQPGQDRATGETSESGKPENGAEAPGTNPPQKGSELEDPEPVKPSVAPNKTDKNAPPAPASPAPSASGMPTGENGTTAPTASVKPLPSAQPPPSGATTSPTPQVMKGAESALAEAAKHQQEAAARQQASRNALTQGGGQDASRQQAERAQRQAMEAQRRAAQARQQAERAIATGNPEAVERALNNAITAQREAIAAQARANGNQRPPNTQPAQPGGNPSGAAASGPAPSGSPVPPNDLGNALETAEATGGRINSMYGEIRALERASTGRIPLNQARRETEAEGAGTGRDAVANTRITGSPSVTSQSPARIVNQAEQKIDAMTARAQRMLDQAQIQQGSSARLFADRMVSLAGQDTGGRTADLSGLMNNAQPGRTRQRLPGDPDYIPPPPPPALPNSAIKAIPGRRVTKGNAPPATWMYVDTWYVIGPFANPARQNLNTKFPPETKVDLDATYPGMGGRKLKWQFWQFNAPEMVPPDHQEYAVYYYYTELYFDSPRDAWVAVGSDDQSTLWMNGQLAWKSSDHLKGWQMGEGLRRVHFKAGRNPILVRLENGWRGAAVSVVVALKD